MSDVIKFTPEPRGSRSEGKTSSSFSVSDLTGGAICLEHPTLASDIPPAPLVLAQDWSNQELASLYRVNRILNLAGRPTTTDRGVSDEGDPWFIFLDARDQIFVHICRIDGRYMIDSPSQTAPVWGSSLTDLTDAFARQNQDAEDAARRAGIVQLVGQAASTRDATDADGTDPSRRAARAKDGNILMHPGAALAAMIWSIALTSEDLSPLHQPEDDLAALSDSGMYDIDPATRVDDADPVALRDMQNGSAAFNPLAVGLNALAITFGLSMWPRPAPVVTLDIDTATTGQDISAEEQADADAAAFDADLLLKVLFTVSPEDSFAEAGNASSHSAEQTALLEEAPALLLEGIEEALVLLDKLEVLAVGLSDNGQDVGDLVATDQPVETVPQDHDRTEEPSVDPLGTATTISTVAPGQTSDASLAEMIARQEAGLKSWLETVEITYDDAQIAIADTDLINELIFPVTDTVDIDPPEITLAYDAFDDTARAFLNFLLGKDAPIQTVSYSTEIVFIDSTVLETEFSGSLYAKSWSFDDGGVVSTIGRKSDFEAFDLVI